MRTSLRALLAGVLVLAALAVSATAASAVSVNPLGPIDAQGTTLQTFDIPSIGMTYTCRWRMQGTITQNQIALGNVQVPIGNIRMAQILCNQPGVQVIPLVSPPGTIPGPWQIGLRPSTGVLGLPNPIGVLVTVLAVRIRIFDPNTGFRCLYTGNVGILVRNGPQPQGQLLPSQFIATPDPLQGDNCPTGLPAIKGPGQYAMLPPWFIGP